MTSTLSVLAAIAALVVAGLHVGFMALESFLWTRPIGRKVFRMSAEEAEKTRVLAANQGIYNGGIALLIVWSVWGGHTATTAALMGFVVAVGVYGAATAARAILFVQALPGAVALALALAAL